MKRSVHTFLGMTLLACFLGAQTLFAPIIDVIPETQAPPSPEVEDISKLAPHVAPRPQEQHKRSLIQRLISTRCGNANQYGALYL